MTNVERRLTRRDFLKVFGGGVAASFMGLSSPQMSSSGTSSASETYAMLYDNTKCIGCNACVVACRLWNGRLGGRFPFLLEDRIGPQEPPEEPKIDEHHFLVIVPHPELRHQDGRGVFQRRSCMHCVEPPCLYVCPTNAIYQYKGINLTDYDRCFGCQYCVIACPYKARVFYEGEGWGVPVKCWFCLDRLEQGLYPACVSVCPVGALDFGTRDEMVAKAYARCDELRAEGREAYVWGAGEEHGTNVIFVSDVPFEELGLPEPEMRVPAPEAYPKLFLERGGLATFGGAALIFLSFALWRRSRIIKAKVKEIPRG